MPINKITVNGRTLIDLSHDTVDKDSLLLNNTAHKNTGQIISGAAVEYPGSDYYLDSDGILHRIKVDRPPCRLRVMTYNTGGWYIGSHTNVPDDKVETYLAIQRHIMETQSPDIAVFQEYWYYFNQGNTIVSKDVLDRYFGDIYQFDVHSTSYGKAMASKSLPFTDYAHYRFNVYVDNPTYGNTYYYGFEKGHINVNGKQICIINTWLDSSDTYWSERESEVAQLLSFVATEPYFILMGDFNVDCPNGTSDTHYTSFIKPFVDAGYNVYNNAVRDGSFRQISTYYRADGTHEALDQIITSSNITVENVFIDRTKLDDLVDEKVDHVPFLADLIIN